MCFCNRKSGRLARPFQKILRRRAEVLSLYVSNCADVRNCVALDLIQYIDVCVVQGYNMVMKTTIDSIIAEVLSLSPQARAFVAEKLIESLDSEPEVVLSPAWREELHKRCREIDEGTVELHDAEKVFARGYAALG